VLISTLMHGAVTEPGSGLLGFRETALGDYLACIRVPPVFDGDWPVPSICVLRSG
jgi:hypothetical protein